MNLPDDICQQVTRLFERMDQAYDQAALASGFACHGCKDNCCLTRFYHHTLLEMLYLKTGLAALPAAQQMHVQSKARQALKQVTEMERRNQPVQVMCPLNEEERCMLYGHRPMICRLHGIPHSLHRPDGRVQSGPGCDDFYNQCAPAEGLQLDRTPLYVEMAEIEKTLRKVLGFNGKIRMTIAEMIIDNSFKFKV